ncbi:MAG: hypothetical protein K2J85_00895 [Anaeroplasmataceae bacterium]|nr:hypothetical protein [Anaeroplasmataceae bacterium]
MEEKIIPRKKIYYIFSFVGLGLAIISISLLATINNLWLNIGCSSFCFLFTIVFTIIYIKKEEEKTNFLGVLGWLFIVIIIALLVVILFVGKTDDTNSVSFLTILFVALDITPSLYLIIKLLAILFSLPGIY